MMQRVPDVVAGEIETPVGRANLFSIALVLFWLAFLGIKGQIKVQGVSASLTIETSFPPILYMLSIIALFWISIHYVSNYTSP